MSNSENENKGALFYYGIEKSPITKRSIYCSTTANETVDVLGNQVYPKYIDEKTFTYTRAGEVLKRISEDQTHEVKPQEMLGFFGRILTLGMKFARNQYKAHNQENIQKIFDETNDLGDLTIDIMRYFDEHVQKDNFPETYPNVYEFFDLQTGSTGNSENTEETNNEEESPRIVDKLLIGEDAIDLEDVVFELMRKGIRYFAKLPQESRDANIVSEN